MDIVTYTLRLDILREALETYQAYAAANQTSAAERTLLALKVFECETMIKELGESP